ncbi:MAG: DUF892 family protein, partial [Chitinophagaceae bacterium]
EEGPVLDAALISAAQKVEHYEIASYGCLTTYAQLMGHDEAKELTYIQFPKKWVWNNKDKVWIYKRRG